MKTETELREKLKTLIERKKSVDKSYKDMSNSVALGTMFSTHLKTSNRLIMQIQTLKWVLSDNKNL